MRKIRFATVIASIGILLGLAACAEDPADQEIFIGSYKGKVSYTKRADGSLTEGVSIRNNNGKVTIGKVGTRHDFYFSDNIPSITGVKIEGQGGTFKGSIGADNSSLIKIENGHLFLNYAKGFLEEVWTADCNRDNKK